MLVLLLLLLAAPGALSAQILSGGHDQSATFFPPVPRLEWQACWFTIPTGVNARCGFLVVPEHRDRDGIGRGRTLRLAVAVLGSRSESPQRDPVVYLNGGPGDGAFMLPGEMGDPMADWWRLSAPFREERDFILIDQRGTGFSQPALDCPEMEAVADLDFGDRNPLPAALAAEQQAARRCWRRLTKAGIDLDAFTTPASADDIADLAMALGVRRINLFGVSYGSRLGLEIMRRHPGLVRSAVLDSVYPPDIIPLKEEPWLVERAFNQLFSDCAGDKNCRRLGPSLEDTFLQLVERLRRRPITLTYPPSKIDPEPHRVWLDSLTVIDGLFTAMYNADEIPFLPVAIHKAARGDYAPLSDYILAPTAASPAAAEGLELAVECREVAPFVTRQELADSIKRHAPYGKAATLNPVAVLCPVWPVRPAPKLEKTPVRSAAPTLLLSGSYDPVTPPQWANHAAGFLKNSLVLEFRDGGHGVTDSHACALEAAASFVARPDPRHVPDCFSNIHRPVFRLRYQ